MRSKILKLNVLFVIKTSLKSVLISPYLWGRLQLQFFSKHKGLFFPLLKFFCNLYSVFKQFYVNILLKVKLTESHPYYHKRYSFRKKYINLCLGTGRKQNFKRSEVCLVISKRIGLTIYQIFCRLIA